VRELQKYSTLLKLVSSNGLGATKFFLRFKEESSFGNIGMSRKGHAPQRLPKCFAIGKKCRAHDSPDRL
jgi:hypothetical protein